MLVLVDWTNRLCLLLIREHSCGAYSWTVQLPNCWKSFHPFSFGTKKRIRDDATNCKLGQNLPHGKTHRPHEGLQTLGCVNEVCPLHVALFLPQVNYFKHSHSPSSQKPFQNEANEWTSADGNDRSLKLSKQWWNLSGKMAPQSWPWRLALLWVAGRGFIPDHHPHRLGPSPARRTFLWEPFY